MNDRELQQILFRSFDVIPLPILVSESIARHDGRSPDMIPQRHHSFLNKAFLEQLGYDLAELPDMASWFQVAYPDEGYRRTIIDS